MLGLLFTSWNNPLHYNYILKIYTFLTIQNYSAILLVGVLYCIPCHQAWAWHWALCQVRHLELVHPWTWHWLSSPGLGLLLASSTLACIFDSHSHLGFLKILPAWTLALLLHLDSCLPLGFLLISCHIEYTGIDSVSHHHYQYACD